MLNQTHENGEICCVRPRESLIVDMDMSIVDVDANQSHDILKSRSHVFLGCRNANKFSQKVRTKHKLLHCLIVCHPAMIGEFARECRNVRLHPYACLST